MLVNRQIAAVLQQAIENIGRLMRCGRDDLDVIGAVLVGDMGVKAEAGIDAIASVDLAATAPRLPPRKNCPSELDVVPSPHTDAIGRR